MFCWSPGFAAPEGSATGLGREAREREEGLRAEARQREGGAPSSVVEHLTFNQGVPGSIPGGPTKGHF